MRLTDQTTPFRHEMKGREDRVDFGECSGETFGNAAGKCDLKPAIARFLQSFD